MANFILIIYGIFIFIVLEIMMTTYKLTKGYNDTDFTIYDCVSLFATLMYILALKAYKQDILNSMVI